MPDYSTGMPCRGTDFVPAVSELAVSVLEVGVIPSDATADATAIATMTHQACRKVL